MGPLVQARSRALVEFPQGLGMRRGGKQRRRVGGIRSYDRFPSLAGLVHLSPCRVVRLSIFPPSVFNPPIAHAPDQVGIGEVARRVTRSYGRGGTVLVPGTIARGNGRARCLRFVANPSSPGKARRDRLRTQNASPQPEAWEREVT